MAMASEEDLAEVAVEAPISTLPLSRSKMCSQQHPWHAWLMITSSSLYYTQLVGNVSTTHIPFYLLLVAASSALHK